MLPHWIDGSPYVEPGARSGPITDPATGRVTGEVGFASAALVDRVVAAAAEAQAGWARVSLARRTQVLFAFRELLNARRHEVAAAITAEHGKVPSDALGEVQRGLEVVEFACALPQLVRGGLSTEVSTGIDVSSLRQPLGVVAVVTPFNFPAMVPLWFLPIALAVGNAVVLKPSEKDPSAANLLAGLWAEAGLPAGVLDVLHGDREAVDALLTHPGVAAVSFVGSTPVARHVYETATAHGKRVQALGGAKNHMVVLPDADLDMAADAAVSAGFGSAGERCMAVSAVVAVDPVGDELVGRIAERVDRIRIGAGGGPGPEPDMGPLITREHRDRVASYLDVGVDEGATLVVDGRKAVPAGEPDGFWLGPSLFDHVLPGSRLHREEIFGPVLSVLRAPTYDAAVALVNSLPFGNGTAIFTRDGGAARRYVTEVEVGMVGVNVPIPVPAAFYSFGGWKASLFGDSHAYGAEGVHFFTRGKVVTTRWPEPDAATAVDLGFPQHQ
jgi:malonate-semialdehyde dehydrogenase (acetylating)/methylmalonate-semialdehyde dehydrogenase